LMESAYEFCKNDDKFLDIKLVNLEYSSDYLQVVWEVQDWADYWRLGREWSEDSIECEGEKSECVFGYLSWKKQQYGSFKAY
jgi:hypothetical protein